MTATEYTKYEQAIADFFTREGLNCLSSQPLDDSDEPEYGEPYFSWRPCDCCGSHLGGNREDMCGYNPTTKEVQRDYSVCVDCVYYVEYGVLDDMTMDEING